MGKRSGCRNSYCSLNAFRATGPANSPHTMSLYQQSATARIVLPVALACMAAGFAMGWWFGGERRDGAREDRRVRPSTAVGLASAGRGQKPDTAVVAAAAKRLFQGPAATDRKAAQAQFRDALRSMDRLERMKNMLVVLDKMTPENGQAYLDGWLDLRHRQPGRRKEECPMAAGDIRCPDAELGIGENVRRVRRGHL